MKVLKPQDISLVNSNVPEDDHPEWSDATDYTIGNRVIVTAEHRIYEAIAASGPSNGGAVDPVADAALAEPKAWVDVGATNRYRMLDEFINTQTESADDLVFTVSVSGCSGVMLANINGMSLTIVHKSADGSAIETITSPLIVPVYNHADYCYAPVEYINRTMFVSLQGEYGSMLEVTIQGSAARLGSIIAGHVYDIGLTLQGPGLGIIDYSKRETDAFGRTTLTKGLNATKLDLPCTIDTGQTSDIVLHRLRDMAGRIAGWIGDESRDALKIMGFYTDFSLTIPYGWDGANDEYTLSIEGVV